MALVAGATEALRVLHCLGGDEPPGQYCDPERDHGRNVCGLSTSGNIF